MVTFISLFLSLIAGQQPIEVAVGEGVAQVELLLDGAEIGVLEGEPWKLTHDFGSFLTPRELLAIAKNYQGKEVGRARLLINVARPRAGAALRVYKNEAEYRGQLSWQAVGYPDPTSVSLQLDSQPLEVADHQDFSLPDLDARVLHLLTAEVTFPDEVVARAWTSFGGQFVGQTDAELTAVAIVGRKQKLSVDSSQMEGWFLQDGEPIPVVALEKGPAEILMVRAPESQDALMELGKVVSAHDPTSAGEFTGDPMEGLSRSLEPNDRFNVLSTWTRNASGRRSAASLFQMLIRDRRVSRKGIPVILTQLFPPKPPVATHRIGDAIAAAGRAAASNSLPRAVILVLSGEPVDPSFHKPEQVRSYLSDLGVPLWVWNITGRSHRPKPQNWGKSQNISTKAGLRKALAKMRDHLDRQHIVWLEGSHLPQSIELSDKAEKVIQLIR